MLELNIYNKNIISKFWFLKAYFISYNIFKNGEIVKILKLLSVFSGFVVLMLNN